MSRAVVERVLAGLDPDLLEYLLPLIEERDFESVSPFLQSAGLAEDDESADALCQQLRDELSGSDGGGGDELPVPPPMSETEDPPALLKAPVSMGGGGPSYEQQEQDRQMRDMLWGTDKVRKDMNLAMETSHKTSKKQERRAAREIEKARQRFEALAAQVAEVDAQCTRMIMPEVDGATMEKDIHVLNFDLHFGGQTLLHSADLHLAYRRRYGLIGKNGVGKTTLLRHMAAFDIEGFPRHHRVLHVRQEAAETTTSVIDTVLSADTELMELLKREKELTHQLEAHDAEGSQGAASSTGDAASEDTAQLSAELEKCYDRLKQIDASTAESRAASILAGLGFSVAMQQAPLSDLSGGWRVRTALAAALFIEPHLLMLDEPTNHLDLEAVVWLQAYLQSYKHTILLVSHDRAFLNEVCSDMVLFANQQLSYFRGNYDTYENTVREQETNKRRLYDAYREKRQHMQEFVDKFRANAKRASMVQSRIKAIEKMDAEAPEEPQSEAPFRFSLPVPEALGRPILQLDDVSFGYPTRNGSGDRRTLFERVQFGLDLDGRVGVVGANGAGKSTLLKLALGELAPSEGTVHLKPQARVKVFTQHHTDQLDLALSPLENLMATYPKAPEAQVRAHLGKFGVADNMALRPCVSLSGGQKSRVVFASLTFGRPHLVIMDEPTNHLDLETIAALVLALSDYKGGVLVVSHDQHFISQVCNELWVVADQTVRRFNGTFEDYKKSILKMRKTTLPVTGDGSGGGASQDGASAAEDL